MKKEEKKPFIQCYILGAIGGILMAAGDWLLMSPAAEDGHRNVQQSLLSVRRSRLVEACIIVGMGAWCFLYPSGR